MNSDINFQRRVSKIPFHGIGLSVDAYDPDLCELMTAFEDHGLSCSYLEIFQASHRTLSDIRSRLPSMVLNYHAEGIWVSQPDWGTSYPLQKVLENTADLLQVLGSFWCNQECASKQMVGYSFGTYVPPLFTKASAAMTAANAASAQAKLDARIKKVIGKPSLLLLETPPLTYFGFGDLPYPEYFRYLTESCPCGLVLDIGHVWTVFRYSGAWRHGSIGDFLDSFLGIFPLERVVQIHLAGLDCHPNLGSQKDLNQAGQTHLKKPSDLRNLMPPPEWIDSHGAPIPEVLFDMLDRVLKSPELVNLKGIALEVDTKPIEKIVEEFAMFQKRFNWWVEEGTSKPMNSARLKEDKSPSAQVRIAPESSLVQTLVHEYEQYVGALTGRITPRHKSFEENVEESGHQIGKYVHVYLPHEILLWGGDLRDMFPHTIQALEKQGIDFSTFVTCWFSFPRSAQEPYDFFLLKIDYFLEFVGKTCPSLSDVVFQEAKELREGYSMANNFL